MENTVINQIEDFRINKASKFFKKLDPIVIRNKKYEDGNAVLIDYNDLLKNKSNDYKLYVYSIKNQTEILLNITEGYLDDNLQGVEMIQSILNDH